MSLKKVYRKIPPPLSDEELLSRTTRVLRECGVENQTQAQFTYEICQEILQRSKFNLSRQISTQSYQSFSQNENRKRSPKSKSNSSKLSQEVALSTFYSLQPHPKVRKNSIPWNQAYSIALSFLKGYGMTTTLATLELEFKNSPEKNIIKDDDDEEEDYSNYLPGEQNNSFMENLTAPEYISYLFRINDSIYNITGNYSYLTNRGKQYSNSKSKNSNSNSRTKSNSNSFLFPVTFKEKVEEFTRIQNLPISNSKQENSNHMFSNSNSEILLDNGSFQTNRYWNNNGRLRYENSANKLREMTNVYSPKKDDEAVEIDIDIENENTTPTSTSLSYNSRMSKSYSSKKSSSQMKSQNKK